VAGFGSHRPDPCLDSGEHFYAGVTHDTEDRAELLYEHGLEREPGRLWRAAFCGRDSYDLPYRAHPCPAARRIYCAFPERKFSAILDQANNPVCG